MALSPKHRLFVAEYLRDKNAARSYRAAGYNEKHADTHGTRLARTGKIADAIRKGLEKQNEKAELRAQDVLNEIKKLAFVDLSNAYDEDGALLHPKKMPADVRAALNYVESDEIVKRINGKRVRIGRATKIKLTDKVRALEMLAKHFKLLTDLHEVSGKDGAPLVVLTMPANGSEAPDTEVVKEKPDGDT